VLVLRGHTRSVVAVAYDPAGQRIASGSYDGTARLWDAQTGREFAILRLHGDHVTCLAFSSDGKRLATVSSDGTVKVWDKSQLMH
jgi:WD40 repeat protein